MINVLFICMGNICRSPMAEAIFTDMIGKAGLRDQFSIDSVGTSGFHTGEPAHPGTRRILAEHNIQYTGSSRQINRSDIAKADYLVVMDHQNMAAIKHMVQRVDNAPQPHLLLEFAADTTRTDVPDPYYENNFEEVYQLVRSGSEGLLAHIRKAHNL